MALDEDGYEVEDTTEADARRDTGLRELLRNQNFRDFVWAILRTTGPDLNNFTSDAMALSYREGQRSIGLLVIQALEDADPLAYAALKQEHKP